MSNQTHYQHFFFDLDNTITRSRSLITPEMHEAFSALQKLGKDIIVVSGATIDQCKFQMNNFPALYLGQNGNHAYDGSRDTELWCDLLAEEEKQEIMRHIRSIPRPWNVKDENDLIEDRGSQISYSLLGHHEDVAVKEKFDPDGAKRRAILAEYPFVSNNLEVKIGGTTTFDYFRKGKNKGTNVIRLIETLGWKKDECVYVGDALYPGGNDEAVLGVIDVEPVENPDATLNYLLKIVS